MRPPSPALSRRARAARVLAAVLVLSVVTQLDVDASAQTGRQVWIEGYTTASTVNGLDQVSVRWSGYTPNAPVYLTQCAVSELWGEFEERCNESTRVNAVSDSTGSGQANFMVRDLRAEGPFFSCGGADAPCGIMVGECSLDVGISAIAPVRIAPFPNGYALDDQGDDLWDQPIDPPAWYASYTAGIPPPQPGPERPTVFPATTRDPVDAVGSSSASLAVERWTAGAAAAPIGVGLDYTETSGPLGISVLLGEMDLGALPDMAVSAVPLTSEQNAALAADGVSVRYVPIGLSAVALAHRNTWGLSILLNDFGLSPELTAAAMSGSFPRLDGALVSEANRGCQFPENESGRRSVIAPGYRVDASSTNFALSSWMSANAPSLWPSGPNVLLPGNGELSGRRNSHELTDLLLRTGGVRSGEKATYEENFSFAALDVSWARQRGLFAARVENPAGNYVLPFDSAVLETLAESTVNPDGTVSVNYSPSGAGAYPLITVHYAIVRSDLAAEKVDEVADLLTWIVSDEGQAASAQSGYVPLPPALRLAAIANIAKIDPSRAPVTPTTTTTTAPYVPIEESGGDPYDYDYGDYGAYEDSGYYSDTEILGEESGGDPEGSGSSEEAVGDTDDAELAGARLGSGSYVPTIGVLVMFAAACILGGPLVGRGRRKVRR